MQSAKDHRSFAIKLAALIALTPFAIDTYLPAIPEIAEQLSADIATINLTVSVYLLGFAVGQLINGPLSDRLGRKPMAIVGLTVFIIASIAIVYAASAQAILVLRFFQALGGGAATVVAGAMVRDQFSGQESARMFSTIGMIMMIAPLIAPAVGSGILMVAEWHAIFIFLALYAAGLLWMIYHQIPETRALDSTPSGSLASHYVNSYAQVFRTGSSMPYLFSQACVSGILLTFITNAPFIYIDYFGINTSHFPLLFAATASSSIGASRLNLHLLQHFERQSILRMAATVQWSLTLILFVYCAFGNPGLWTTLILLCSIIATIGLCNANNMSLFLDFHPKTGGSANAVFGCATFAAGGLLGGLSSLLHDGTLLPIGLILLLSSSCSGLLLLLATRPGKTNSQA